MLRRSLLTLSTKNGVGLLSKRGLWSAGTEMPGGLGACSFSSQGPQSSQNPRKGRTLSSIVWGGLAFGAATSLFSTFLDEGDEQNPHPSYGFSNLEGYGIPLPFSFLFSPPPASPLSSPTPLPSTPPQPQQYNLLSSAPTQFSFPSPLPTPPPNSSSSSPSDQVRYGLANAAEKALPAVVRIFDASKSAGIGSGMILSSKGTILTNFHVIQPWVGGRGWGDGGGGWKERRIPIALSDGRCFDAQLLAFDQNFDVAVLEIIAPPSALPFPFLELGVSKNLRVGEWALAVGAPLNLGKTVTAGIISNLGRSDFDLGGSSHTRKYIQTDAVVTGGNSGGPLVDWDGKVIGVVTAQIAGQLSWQAGFALPIDLVRWAVAQLQTHGRVVRPWLGFSMRNHAPDQEQKGGLLITDVEVNSPAWKAGLERGSVIWEVNGLRVLKKEDLNELLYDPDYDPVGRPFRMRGMGTNGRVFDLSISPEAHPRDR